MEQILYDLIRTSNIILTNYEGTELNGLVSDDSIVNSVVKMLEII